MTMMKGVIESTEQFVRNYRKASKALRKKYNTRKKAREFLIKAGFLERDKKSPDGLRPTKPYR
jgi:hypothetical protein